MGQLGGRRVGRALCGLSGSFACDATSAHDLHLLVVCCTYSHECSSGSFQIVTTCVWVAWVSEPTMCTAF